jgi:hypothetical protein
MCQTNAPSKPDARNNPPSFFVTTDKTVNANQVVTFAVSATDPDGEMLAFACVSKPRGAAFDKNNAVFSWAPSIADTGRTRIIFSTTDGHVTIFDTVMITVRPVAGHPPVFASHQKYWIAQVNQKLSIDIHTINPLSDSVTIGALSSPAGSQSINAPFSGAYTYLYTPSIKDTGASFPVIFSAWNSSGFAYDTITFEVQRQNIAVGTWDSVNQDFTITATFSAAMAFTLELLSQNAVFAIVSGAYTIEGATVTMTPTSCTVQGDSTECSEPLIATISGNHMAIPNGDGTSFILTKTE